VVFDWSGWRWTKKGAGGLSVSSSRVSSSPSTTVPPTPKSEGEILQSANVKSFAFTELHTATRNFRPDSMLGEGGFGSVFKGWVDETTLAPAKPGTGMVIAVKKLNQEGFQGHREWLVSTTLNFLYPLLLNTLNLFLNPLLLNMFFISESVS
jgi:hypothetical protein